MTKIWNLLQQWHQGSIVFKVTSRKTEIAKSAREPKLQELLAENAPAIRYLEQIGDLITADHKVLNEGGEFRNSPRYAAVVQDLATQWSQSYPRKTKTSQETEKISRKFLEPSRKSFALTIYWNLREEHA